jgi:MoaA/NifB/PqqE/SkfB family radical SAM enzyme
MHRLDPAYIPLDHGMRLLQFLYDNKFILVYFTGGEPTLHPDLVSLVQHASRLGLVTSMTTNGTSSLTTLAQLRDAGLDVLSVSLDHWDGGVCERVRGHRRIQAKQEAKLRYAKQIGLRVYALAYLNPLLCEDGAIQTYVEYVNQMLDIPVAFCFPTTSDENTYRLRGVGSEVDFSKLYQTIHTILQLKRGGHRILNPTVYLEDILRFLRRKPPAIYCRGGEDVVYIDWLGNTYPCFLRPKLFNALEDVPLFLRRVQCSDCVINCFREPSIFAQFPKRSTFLLREHPTLSFLFSEHQGSVAS